MRLAYYRDTKKIQWMFLQVLQTIDAPVKEKGEQEEGDKKN